MSSLSIRHYRHTIGRSSRLHNNVTDYLPPAVIACFNINTNNVGYAISVNTTISSNINSTSILIVINTNTNINTGRICQSPWIVYQYWLIIFHINTTWAINNSHWIIFTILSSSISMNIFNINITIDGNANTGFITGFSFSGSRHHIITLLTSSCRPKV